MKILHVNTNDNGGAAIAAIRLHYALLETGIDSKILFLRRSGTSTIREAYYFEDMFTSVSGFKLLLKLNTAYNRRYTFYKPDVYFNGPDSLFDISRHELFRWADIVHLHWVVKFLDWEKVFSQKKKFVWTLHDMNPMTGGEHYKTGYNGEFSAVARRNILRKKHIINPADLTVIAPSHWIGRIAGNSEVFSGKKIVTLRNPVSPDIFRVMSVEKRKVLEGIPREKKIILFVAENPDDKRKGFEWLMKALSGFENKDAYFLLVIGRKSVDIPRNIDALLLGSIHDETLMSQIYNAADVFVIPSLEDNLPNTVSEALLCGTPVAGMRTGGIAEMVTDQQNGFLAGEPAQLGEAILRCLDMHQSREFISAQARQELDPEKLLPAFIKVYTS